MENNQITQQSSESNSSQPSLSRRWGNSANSYFLVNLIKHRPWLLWVAVTAFLFTTIYLSLVSITQTGFVKNEQPKPTPVVTENPEATSSQTDNSVFLWLLGVVILGSGASAIAIAKILPTLSQSQLYQHFQSTSTKAFARRRQRKLLLQSKQQMSFIPPVASEAAPSPIVSVPPPESQEQFQVEERILIVLDNQPLNLGEESEAQLLTQEEILSFSEQEWLDIVPDSEDNNSIAVGTESLAEMLDLRKKLPLSTLLGENFQMLGNKK
jgi:hypothetical protein